MLYTAAVVVLWQNWVVWMRVVTGYRNSIFTKPLNFNLLHSCNSGEQRREYKQRHGWNNRCSDFHNEWQLCYSNTTCSRSCGHPAWLPVPGFWSYGFHLLQDVPVQLTMMFGIHLPLHRFSAWSPSTAPNFNAVVELLGGPCGSLTSLPALTWQVMALWKHWTYSNLVAGNTYFIRVYIMDQAPAIMSLALAITSPVIPTCPAKFGRRCSQCTFVALYFKRTHNKRKKWYHGVERGGMCNSNYYQGTRRSIYFSPAVKVEIYPSHFTSGSSDMGNHIYVWWLSLLSDRRSCVDYSQSNSGNQFCMPMCYRTHLLPLL